MLEMFFIYIKETIEFPQNSHLFLRDIIPDLVGSIKTHDFS